MADANLRDYVNYMRRETEEKNQTERSLDSCRHDQMLWDMFSTQLKLSPSDSLSKRLNKPVLARQSGYDVYDVKRCTIPTKLKIIPTLITGDEETTFTINNRQMSLKSLFISKGIPYHVNICLTRGPRATIRSPE